MGSRPGRRVVVYSVEGRTMPMEFCDLHLTVVKLLIAEIVKLVMPEIIKLFKFIIRKLQKANAAPPNKE